MIGGVGLPNDAQLRRSGCAVWIWLVGKDERIEINDLAENVDGWRRPIFDARIIRSSCLPSAIATLLEAVRHARERRELTRLEYCAARSALRAVRTIGTS